MIAACCLATACAAPRVVVLDHQRDSSVVMIRDSIRFRDSLVLVPPMVTYWLSNPVTWTPQIENLSWRVEPVLLKMMANELGIKELNIILRYLQSNGTKAAIPAVQELLKHSDNMIRFSAKTTLQKLESRD